MANEETENLSVSGHQVQGRGSKIYEDKLFESVSKTHSVSSFFWSFGVDILCYGSIFFAGYKHFRPIWIIPPMIALVIKDLLSAEMEKRRFDEVKKALRDEDKQLVLSDPNQLPAWVRFPDIERCNWLNNLLAQFWPHVCSVVSRKIKTEVEPSLDKLVPGLKIQKLSLGSVAPKIYGVKVYDQKVSSSHVIIDASLSYSGDSEFRFSYLGIPGGVDNLQLRGAVRIDFLIIQNIPFFAGVEFCFLGPPEIDFMLTGVGSLGFIEEAIRKVIHEQISSQLIFPKTVGTMWTEKPRDDIHEPEGVIRINVIEARNLENKDLRGLSDPYVTVNYGSKTYLSRVIDGTLNPWWDFWCEFVADTKATTVNLTVMDKDNPQGGNADDLIGTCDLGVSDIRKGGKLDSWVKLKGSKGEVHVRARFLNVSSDVKHVTFPPPELSFLSAFILTVLVKSAHNLMLPRTLKKPSAKVQLTVCNDTQETKTVKNHGNPVFDETFSFFVNNPDFARLRAKVVDEEEKSEIGSFCFCLRKLLDRKNLEIIDQHSPLVHSASDCTIILSMRLTVIRNVFS